jgi:hypothetical protein
MREAIFSRPEFRLWIKRWREKNKPDGAVGKRLVQAGALRKKSNAGLEGRD